jgi:hypothetical protein
VAKLQGIVSSEFVRMDYGEAIAVLERPENCSKLCWKTFCEWSRVMMAGS